MKLDVKSDSRGDLAEFLPSVKSGRVYIFTTKPRVTRGNHYHRLLIEKFLVVEGQAVISCRTRGTSIVRHIPVRGSDFQVVEIFPDTVHSITNVGTTNLVTVVWGSELFDAENPDTYSEEVCESQRSSEHDPK
jgi:UDP-2-acetamido-2,6-beta-L-arabino-hexul-4-ose reductase